MAADDPDLAAFHFKVFGQELDQGSIGFTFHRRSGQIYL